MSNPSRPPQYDYSDLLYTAATNSGILVNNLNPIPNEMENSSADDEDDDGDNYDGAGGDEGEDDLYGDLEGNIFDREGRHHTKYETTELRSTEGRAELEKLLADAYEENHLLKLKLKELTTTNSTVLKNASSLHETAKLQILQKNQVVTSLQKKLQEFRTRDPSHPVKPNDWKEIDTMISSCLSSVPTYSFAELCQEAIKSVQTGKDKDQSIKKAEQRNNWKKRFRYENFACYFYSHHEEIPHTEPITNIQYVDPPSQTDTESNPVKVNDPLVPPSLPLPVISVTINSESRLNQSHCSDGELTHSPTPPLETSANSSLTNTESTRLSKQNQAKRRSPSTERNRNREKHSRRSLSDTSKETKRRDSEGDLQRSHPRTRSRPSMDSLDDRDTRFRSDKTKSNTSSGTRKQPYDYFGVRDRKGATSGWEHRDNYRDSRDGRLREKRYV